MKTKLTPENVGLFIKGASVVNTKLVARVNELEKASQVDRAASVKLAGDLLAKGVIGKDDQEICVNMLGTLPGAQELLKLAADEVVSLRSQLKQAKAEVVKTAAIDQGSPVPASRAGGSSPGRVDYWAEAAARLAQISQEPQ